NPHFVCLTLIPDSTLVQKEKDEETQELLKIRSLLTEEETEKILTQDKQLAEYQLQIEHQSLECLPKISLNEVQKKAKDYLLSQNCTNSLSVLQHQCFTNRIIYADLIAPIPF